MTDGAPDSLADSIRKLEDRLAMTGGVVDSLTESVDKLQTRLATIEKTLAANQHPQPHPATVPHVAPIVPAILITPDRSPVPQPPPLPPSAVLPNVPKTLSMQPRYAAPSFKKIPKPPGVSLETKIGKNLASWVGAIVLVLGVFFFLKYAWDQGWIRPTPAMRIIAAIALGVAIAAIGEWLFIKQRAAMKQLAGALHGAGLAILFASFFAAYAAFPPEQRVLEIPAAFAGVIATAAIGILLAFHIDSMTPAAIALIGAYLAPAILSTGQDKSLQLLSYLLILAAVGWGLNLIRPRWVAVHFLCWIGTVLWYAAWWYGASLPRDHDTLAIVFASIYYAGYLVEIFFATQRLSRQRDNSPSIAPPPSEATLSLLSLLNTSAFFAALYSILEPQPHVLLGCIAIALAALHGGASLVTQSRPFKLSSLLQAAALATLAAPLILNEFSITIAWLIMAAAVVTLGRLLAIRNLHYWGLALLLLAVARVAFIDSSNPSLRTPLLHFGDGQITQWLLLAWTCAILAHVIAWLAMNPAPAPTSPSPAEPDQLPPMEALMQHGPRVLSYARRPMASPANFLSVSNFGPSVAVFGSAIFLLSCFTQWTTSEWTVLASLWLAAIIALIQIPSSPGYLAHSVFLAVALSIKWFSFDNVYPLLRYWEHPDTAHASAPILNLTAAAGVILLLDLAGLAYQTRLLASDAKAPQARIAREIQFSTWTTWIAFLAFALINFESLRTVDYLAATGQDLIADPTIIKQVVLSVLWALAGFTMIAIGFRRKIPTLRYIALGLLTVTLIKIFLIDMAEVKALWRILSFLAVGALLMAVSYLYHRQTAGLLTPSPVENAE